MKKMILVGMLVISGLSFARDYTYNERRDILQPLMEQHGRVARHTTSDWAMAGEQRNENFVKYSHFNQDLDHMDRGHEDD